MSTLKSKSYSKRVMLDCQFKGRAALGIATAAEVCGESVFIVAPTKEALQKCLTNFFGEESASKDFDPGQFTQIAALGMFGLKHNEKPIKLEEGE